jgi:hypothetical protein
MPEKRLAIVIHFMPFIELKDLSPVEYRTQVLEAA